MGDFVTPEPIRVSLSGGKYIDIQKRLSHGQTEDMYARMSPHAISLERREVRTAKILAYLLGWSLTMDGIPVPYHPQLPESERNDLIRNLDPDLAIEIYEAIQTHELALDKARTEEKKRQAGSSGAGVTSPLPPTVTGALAGSVN